MRIILLLLAVFTAFMASSQQKVGINTNAPIETLDVNGNFNLRGLLKLNNNAGSDGQVLTSKGSGEDPIWTNTAYSGGGRFFSTYMNNSNSVGRQGFTLTSPSVGQEDSLDWGVASTSGTDFTVITSGSDGNHVLINRTGLYHFEGTIRIFATIPASEVMLPRAYLKFRSDQPGPLLNHDFYLQEAQMERVAGSSVGGSSTFHNLAINFRMDIHLAAGTTATFITGMTGLKYPLISIGVSTGGYLTGQFIAE